MTSRYFDLRVYIQILCNSSDRIKAVIWEQQVSEAAVNIWMPNGREKGDLRMKFQDLQTKIKVLNGNKQRKIDDNLI